MMHFTIQTDPVESKIIKSLVVPDLLLMLLPFGESTAGFVDLPAGLADMRSINVAAQG